MNKRGATIEFWLEGEKVLSYTDPNPLQGGVPGVLAVDNGVAVARARVASAEPPAPRTDALVTLDDPWYPDWANVGRPLALDFPHTCATSGKPVTLAMKPREAPANEHAAPVIEGKRISFTPQTSGDHWYQITAGDGNVASPSFHLTLPVFNPALGRDDSHAVVLYRFTEGKGNVIADQSAGGQPLNLVIPDGAPVVWLPGQGINVRGAGRIMTKGAAEKLMALAKSKAATLELWIAPDTMHPPTYWVGGLLAWEHPKEKRNFALAQLWNDLCFAPYGITFKGYQGGATFGYGIRTGLQHVVVTWDGRTTRFYVNGNQGGQGGTPWNETKWDPTAPLILGSLGADQPAYLQRAGRNLRRRALRPPHPLGDGQCLPRQLLPGGDPRQVLHPAGSTTALPGRPVGKMIVLILVLVLMLKTMISRARARVRARNFTAPSPAYRSPSPAPAAGPPGTAAARRCSPLRRAPCR